MEGETQEEGWFEKRVSCKCGVILGFPPNSRFSLFPKDQSTSFFSQYIILSFSLFLRTFFFFFFINHIHCLQETSVHFSSLPLQPFSFQFITVLCLLNTNQIPASPQNKHHDPLVSNFHVIFLHL